MRTADLYRFQEDENSTLKKVSGQLVRTANPIVNQEKFILAGIYDFMEGADGPGR